MLHLRDSIGKAADYSKHNNAHVLFHINLDNSSFKAETIVPETEDTDPSENREMHDEQTGLLFLKAKNSSEEVQEGSITFRFLPDGTKEFGLITVLDPETDYIYTVFINPYLSYPEIFSGETVFYEEFSF